MSLSFHLRFFRSALFTKLPVPTPSFEGQTIIITGASSGLGLVMARYVVSHSASRVILACRNVEKGKAAAAEICSATGCAENILEVWKLDMASSTSILAFADKVCAELPQLDTFIANAGISNIAFRTVEADEESIYVNVVGTYLLAFLLHPKLRETAAAKGVKTRCCIVGSDTYEMAKLSERHLAPDGKLFETLADEQKSDMKNRYAVSKLLVLLAGRQMAALAPVDETQVIINIMNPGLSQSDLGAEHGVGRGLEVRIFLWLFARTPEEGIRTLIYGASAPPESHGKFVNDCRIDEPTLGLARGEEGAKLQKRIWNELCTKLEAVRPGVTLIV